ncbi:non-structural maintenance of chromosomes element 4 homolog A-like [Rosa rugosa]|uniref:non-structural maintenance of chromosomes element 4 homolog A-like n=1 Tax=Rosa rugosa TaxID=74645 RepID=UPI002B402D29|nr:non-structural maintenance of chromosomes element 4 homolog A-like [Rosa rugosa]
MAEKECTVNFELLNFGQDPVPRRELRSDYLAVRSFTSEKRDDLMSPDSMKFDVIIDIVDKLHEQVQLPREQVADAQALNTVVASVMSHSNGETTPSDFITGLITYFGQVNRPSVNKDNAHVSLKWKDIGFSVSPILKRAVGCCIMLGPMNIEIKQRKVAVHAGKPTTNHLPKEVLVCVLYEKCFAINNEGGERTDTDLNMATMFEILKNKKRVELSCLILNRRSFAQTVENLFALSFLAKDGRVRIAVEANGSHIVSPTNGPVANEVAYHHFVFRFDFKDWKIMMEMVAVGEELMPHRDSTKCTPASEEQPAAFNSQTATALHTTRIQKLTRNHALVVQQKSAAEEFFENDDAVGATELRRCKRRLSFNTCLSGSLS